MMETSTSDEFMSVELRPAPAAPAESAEPSIFARLPWLLAMEALAVTILVYPLRLKDAWLGPMVREWELRANESPWARFALDQIESIISFYYSPLVLKGILASACGLGVIGTLLAAGAMSSGGTGDRRSLGERLAFMTWPVFLGWGVATAMWSPTPPLSLEAIVWLAVLGGLGFALLRRGFTPDELNQLACLLLLLGTAVAFVSLAQSTEAFDGAIFSVMFKFDDVRNVYGSLVGHNTEVASFLLMTLFPALALAGDARRGGVRWLARAYVLLALLVILIVQSRAIWLLAPPLLLGFLWVAARQAGRRRVRWALATFYLALAAGLGIATQVIDAPWNVFYRADNPIERRLNDLTPDRLLAETRLRILACSGSLVTERPVLGWGLNSFQYVFPKVQGDYFARHPDTRVVPTTRRANMAHNEYLQVLIEEGAIGLILMLAALAEVAWRGLRAGAKLPRAVTTLHAAFGFSALSIVLHALVHFPFHVPQLLVPWLFCLAAFGGARGAAPPAAEADPGLAPIDESARAGFRTGNVVRLVAALLFILAIPLGNIFFARALQADSDFCHGSVLSSSLRNAGSGLDRGVRDRLLGTAIDHLRRAVRLQPSHDQARYYLGELHYYRGVAQARDNAALDAKFATPNFAAVESLHLAIQYFEESLKALRYHSTYYMLALCYKALIEILPPEQSGPFKKAFTQNLELAAYYAPPFAQVQQMLAEWLAVQPQPNAGRILAARRAIRKYDPGFFHVNYEAKVNHKIQERDLDQAVSGAEAILLVDDADPSFHMLAIEAHMLAGGPAHHARVLELVQKFRALPLPRSKYPQHPYYGSFAGLYERIIRQDWPGCLDELGKLWPGPAWVLAREAAVERYAREKTGRTGLPSLFKKPAGMSDADWELQFAEQRAIALYRWIGDLPAALAAFRERLGMAGAAPGLEFWLDCACLARELGEPELLAQAMGQIRMREPQHPILGRLEAPAPSPAAPETRG